MDWNYINFIVNGNYKMKHKNFQFVVNLVNIFVKNISGKGQFLHMNNLNLYFRFICFSPCSKTFNWAENIFPMSHLLKQSHKCGPNTAWTTTVTICHDLTFKFETADMMTKMTNNESKYITVKVSILFVIVTELCQIDIQLLLWIIISYLCSIPVSCCV